MKTIATVGIMLVIAAAASAADLPFPAIAAGKLYLPFGQQLNEPGQKEKITGFEEPQCSPEMCRWAKETPEGQVFLDQRYERGVLVGFGLTYILLVDAAPAYEAKLREMKDKLDREAESGDWIVRGPEDIIQSDLNFTAESRDVRVTSKFRKGEHSTTIAIDISAR